MDSFKMITDYFNADVEAEDSSSSLHSDSKSDSSSSDGFEKVDLANLEDTDDDSEHSEETCDKSLFLAEHTGDEPQGEKPEGVVQHDQSLVVYQGPCIEPPASVFLRNMDVRQLTLDIHPRILQTVMGCLNDLTSKVDSPPTYKDGTDMALVPWKPLGYHACTNPQVRGYRELYNQLVELRKEMRLCESTLDLKTALLENIGEELRRALHGRETFMIANETLATTNQKLQAEKCMARLICRDLEEAQAMVTSLSYVNCSTQDQLMTERMRNESLCSQTNRYQRQFSQSEENSEREIEAAELLTKTKNALSEEVSDLKQFVSVIQNELDTLIFNLCSKGMVKVTDANGNPISLERLSVPLDDSEWQTVKTRKHEVRFLAIISSQQHTVEIMDRLMDDVMSSNEALLFEKYQLESKVNELEFNGKGQEQTIDLQEQIIENHDHTIEGQRHTIEGHGQTIQGHEQTIQKQEQTIQGQEQTIERLEQTVQGQGHTIKGQEQTIEGQRYAIEGQEQTIADLTWRYEIQSPTSQLNDHSTTKDSSIQTASTTSSNLPVMFGPFMPKRNKSSKARPVTNNASKSSSKLHPLPTGTKQSRKVRPVKAKASKLSDSVARVPVSDVNIESDSTPLYTRCIRKAMEMAFGNPWEPKSKRNSTSHDEGPAVNKARFSVDTWLETTSTSAGTARAAGTSSGTNKAKDQIQWQAKEAELRSTSLESDVKVEQNPEIIELETGLTILSENRKKEISKARTQKTKKLYREARKAKRSNDAARQSRTTVTKEKNNVDILADFLDSKVNTKISGLCSVPLSLFNGASGPVPSATDVSKAVPADPSTSENYLEDEDCALERLFAEPNVLDDLRDEVFYLDRLFEEPKHIVDEVDYDDYATHSFKDLFEEPNELEDEVYSLESLFDEPELAHSVTPANKKPRRRFYSSIPKRTSRKRAHS